MGDFETLIIIAATFVFFGVGIWVLQLFFNGLIWIDGKIRGVSVDKTRPSFMLWTLNHREMAIDPALEAYIRKYKLHIQTTLDEPPEIVAMRTKVAILEESGFYAPTALSNVYTTAIKGHVEMWDQGNEELRETILRSIKKAQLQYKRR